MGLILSTKPETVALDYADVARNLVLEDDLDKELVEGLISTATRLVEDVTGLALRPQGYTWYLDDFPADAGTLVVPRPPLTAISKIEYLDLAGSLQTLNASLYVVDRFRAPGRIIPSPTSVGWPSTQDTLNAVTVTLTAGYPEADGIPEPIIQGMQLLVGDWYEHREALLDSDVVRAVLYMLNPYRMPRLA